MNPTIRPAELPDLPALTEMGCRFIETTSYSAFVPPKPEKLFDLFFNMLQAENNAIFVADLEGTAVGMIAVFVTPSHVTGELTCGEVVWWMNPEVRGGGRQLLKAAEQWATEQGATAIDMVAPTDRVGRYYTALGYNFVESTYRKAL